MNKKRKNRTDRKRNEREYESTRVAERWRKGSEGRTSRTDYVPRHPGIKPERLRMGLNILMPRIPIALEAALAARSARTHGHV